jgi:hypothetical protein
MVASIRTATKNRLREHDHYVQQNGELNSLLADRDRLMVLAGKAKNRPGQFHYLNQVVLVEEQMRAIKL